MNPIAGVVQQYCDAASTLWLRRDRATGQPHFTLADLVRLDGQLEAHLDGLRTAGEFGWRAAAEELRWNEADLLFPAAVLAWESAIPARVEKVAACAVGSYECSRALVSSLGWLPDLVAVPHIEKLLGSSNVGVQRMGLAAWAVRRRDPGHALAAALASSDAALKARAFRTIGELGRIGLVPQLKEELQSREYDVRFWAAWSLARLSGGRPAIETLRQAVESQSPHECRALQMVLRRIEPAEAVSWLKGLAQDFRSTRAAVVGAGIVGTPDTIAWLLETMATPALARVAGESFSMITGVDLAAEQLEGKRPEGFSAGPTEDPADESVEMDPDENLAWPDSAGLEAWWEKRRDQFVPGTRYLCGRPLSEPWLEEVLASGYQRQRTAAALELALLRSDQPLFNTSAPGQRQQELLGLRKRAPEA